MGFQPRRPQRHSSPAEARSLGHGPPDPRKLELLRDLNREEAVLLTDMANSIAKIRYDERHTQLSFKTGEKVMLIISKRY